MQTKLKTYAFRHAGSDGGDGASLVVAEDDQSALTLLQSYLREHPANGERRQNVAVVPLTIGEHSQPHRAMQILTDGPDVKHEYQLVPDGAYMRDRLIYLCYGAAELANELDRLQAEKHKVVGVPCIRRVCARLRAGDLDSAKSLALDESDKIHSYDDITALLGRAGFWFKMQTVTYRLPAPIK